MARINTQDYLGKIEELSPQEVIGAAVHTIGNRANSIMGAADLLRMYLADIEALPCEQRQQLERLLDMIGNNTQDIANVLDALGDYNVAQIERNS